MAPRRSNLGWVAAAATCVALAVTGCGGGSSSSTPGTAGGSTSKSATATSKPETNASSNSGANAEAEAKPEKSSQGDAGKKKNPPLELPEGKPEEGPTKAEQASVPTAAISLAVPGGLTTANTCKGANESPELTWKNIPPGTAELAIFAVNVQPVQGKLYFDWALAGVDPSLSGLKAGEVPDGAVLGRTSSGKNGYSLCPKGSARENYIFSVYALPKSLSPQQGFDPLDLRTQATPVAKEVGLINAFFPN